MDYLPTIFFSSVYNVQPSKASCGHQKIYPQQNPYSKETLIICNKFHKFSLRNLCF